MTGGNRGAGAQRPDSIERIVLDMLVFVADCSAECEPECCSECPYYNDSQCTALDVFYERLSAVGMEVPE